MEDMIFYKIQNDSTFEQKLRFLPIKSSNRGGVILWNEYSVPGI
jgi:hypothetical protein